MIKKSTLLLFILIALGCKENKGKEIRNELEVTFSAVTSDDRIKHILDEYIKEMDCKDCIHEIFFDRFVYNQTIITLRSRGYNKEYLLNQKPLLQLTYKEIPFIIYSGMEGYFDGKFDFREKGGEKTEWSMKYIHWTVIDSVGKLKIYKEGSLPYTAIPGVSYCQ
ncbi:hypothetical protein [Rufibacter psychrotolerans]|uniref:hypothetical protein n=1 Tax=Rufibacter psychrotolerans TaxID=2812556 RepID=UPI00196824DE|nr:hypothetical protein [Rufibacter sp. SYSU D00308]